MSLAVRLRNVSKSFRIYPRQRERILEAITFGRLRYSRDFWALRDINLDVEAGTSLGILGRNGAGKSTMLEIVAGILQPTAGTVETNGQIVLLQIGAGINPQFTGRENVMLTGLILGIDRKKMLERFDEIEEFADLGDFMDQPVKNYSSGMRSRLGFAVAVNVEPDILIVDESLSVGDALFKAKGLQKMRELRDRGTTILFVSHSTSQIKDFCEKGVLLHEGRMIAHGDVAEVADRYQALLASIRASEKGGAQDGYRLQEEENDFAPSFKENPDLARRAKRLRHGTGEARISHVEVLDEQGRPTEEVSPEERVTVRVHVEYEQPVPASAVGITLRNNSGLDVFSTSTALEGRKIGPKAKGERLIADFSFQPALRPGLYSVGAFVSPPAGGHVFLDWVDVAAVFEVGKPQERRQIPGLFHLPTEVAVHSLARRSAS
ncbi:ABC transporter ATP-binding protein [Rubrobacter calidifluminis]|uniref:ABC transporter ATP-binding protein n=1 Tax=Rubrobacter calidifluminis TaxID=1392640 RepID=UPI0023624306|nr:ABC transporter ATP-binding protein [Rubrobacter calidifluminis]